MVALKRPVVSVRLLIYLATVLRRTRHAEFRDVVQVLGSHYAQCATPIPKASLHLYSLLAGPALVPPYVDGFTTHVSGSSTSLCR